MDRLGRLAGRAAFGKETIAAACHALRRPLAVLEGQLAGRQWIVGDRFTVADLNIAEVLRYAQSEEALFDAHPNIKAWIERCQSRPAYKRMQGDAWQGADRGLSYRNSASVPAISSRIQALKSLTFFGSRVPSAVTK